MQCEQAKARARALEQLSAGDVWLWSGHAVVKRKVASEAMSVIMSDMKTLLKRKPKVIEIPPDTFTVRDMSRRAAAVIAACEYRGSVRIRSRNGRSFVLTPEVKQPTRSEHAKTRAEEIERMRAHHERMKEMGCRVPSEIEQERMNRWIAGEV